MGKNWLSCRKSNEKLKNGGGNMVKIILKTLLCVSLFLVCLMEINTCDKNNNIVYFKKVFIKKDSVLIKDSWPISEIIDIKKYNDKTYLVVDFYSKSIFELDRNSLNLKKIGKNGKGPGEYIFPFKIQIADNGNIFYSDYSKRCITEIDLNGNYINEVQSKFPINNFFVNSFGKILVLTPQEYELIVLEKSGEITKKIKNIPDSKSEIILHIKGGGLCGDNNGNIFFSNVVDYIINKLDSNFDIINTFGNEKADFYKKLKNTNDKVFNKVFTNLVGLYFLNVDNGYICAKFRNKDKVYIDIWDLNGVFIKTVYFEKNEYMVNINDRELFTIEERPNKDGKTLYILNMYNFKNL